MTIVQKFRCRACLFEQGPIGTHGYHPESGSGELIGVCKRCVTLCVVQVRDHQFKQDCARCRTPVERFNNTHCPSCGSADAGYEPAW